MFLVVVVAAVPLARCGRGQRGGGAAAVARLGGEGDEVDHHGTRPVGGVRTEQRLDGMNVASVVHQTVEFTDLGENVVDSRIDGGSLAEVARHGK